MQLTSAAEEYQDFTVERRYSEVRHNTLCVVYPHAYIKYLTRVEHKLEKMQHLKLRM